MLVLENSPQDNIDLAALLCSEAIERLLTAGRLLDNAKSTAKRSFKKLIENAQLEKTQVNKLMKAASVADGIPTEVSHRLGLHQILQLGQPKNQAALEVIAPEDTQVTVAQKIKENRPTTKPVNAEAVKFVGKKGSQTKLRIEIPNCQETEIIYSEWKASGLTALEWLQAMNMQLTQPQAIGSTSSGIAATEASTTVAMPTPEDPSVLAVSEEFLNNNSLATLVSRATETTETTEATTPSEAEESRDLFTTTEVTGFGTDFLALPQPGDELHFTNNSSAVVLGVDKEARELLAGGMGDSSDGDSTPPEREPLNRSGGLRPMFRSAPQQESGVISPCKEPPSPCLFVESASQISLEFIDGFNRCQNIKDESLNDLHACFCPNQPVVDQLVLPTQQSSVGSTNSYKHDWKVGDLAMANTVSTNFYEACQEKPVTVEKVQTSVGNIQILVVRTHSGQSRISFGNWIEELDR